jgi:hypothetical protein
VPVVKGGIGLTDLPKIPASLKCAKSSHFQAI